ncbi:MAG: hypothetical protein Sapg2KO_00010 [Saprospiraceae bacterium]
MRNSRFFILLIVLFSTFKINAQLEVEDFNLSGAATVINDQCIRLVPDFQYISGSAWYKRPIDLNSPFEMEICLMLGEKDEDGADGIVFAFYPRMVNTGFRGEGMGFAGLYPSLGIEFDTYTNYHLNDPIDDHLAIMTNGRIAHYGNGLEPVSLGNIEDGGRHRLKIFWKPEEQIMEVFLDSELKMTFTSDLVNDIFQGNSTVYWGVTAATGRLSNNHEICIKKLIFTEAQTEDKTPKVRGQR